MNKDIIISYDCKDINSLNELIKLINNSKLKDPKYYYTKESE